MVKRTDPNIIITGTPGVGKTTHAQLLAQNNPDLKHLAINQVAKERDCYDGRDEELGSWIVDEDKVCIFFPLSLEQIANSRVFPFCL